MSTFEVKLLRRRGDPTVGVTGLSFIVHVETCEEAIQIAKTAANEFSRTDYDNWTVTVAVMRS